MSGDNTRESSCQSFKPILHSGLGDAPNSMDDGTEACKTTGHERGLRLGGNKDIAFPAFVVDFVDGHGMNERRRVIDLFISS